MHAALSSYSETELSSVLVVGSLVVALTWFATDLQGVSRVATAALAGAVACLSMLVGLDSLD